MFRRRSAILRLLRRAIGVFAVLLRLLRRAIWFAVVLLMAPSPVRPAQPPWNVELVGQYRTPGLPYGVFVSGTLAYVTAWESGLLIIDVSDPSSPTLRGAYDTAFPYKVHVSGTLAYIATAGGLQIVDASDPSSPTLRGVYDTRAYTAYDVDISANLAYVTVWGRGLQIVDVSNPSSPTLRGSYDWLVDAYRVFVSGNLAYVAAFGSRLKIIDVGNPASPQPRGSYDTLGYAEDVYVSGDLAYVAEGGSGLQILDVSNPSSPTLRGSYSTAGQASDVFVSGGLAYVTEWFKGLRIVDVSDPASPQLRGSYDTPRGTAYAVYVSGNLAYVADRYTGLWIFRYTGPLPVAPAAPSSLTATARDPNSVYLTWRDNSTNEAGFTIQRRRPRPGWADEITTITLPANSTVYLNANLVRDTLYYYRVRAFNGAGASAWSNETSVRTFPIAAPSTLAATVALPNQIRLTWRDNSDNEAGFTIQRRRPRPGLADEITTITVAANCAVYLNTNLARGTRYYYRVRAFNSVVVSAWSNEASARTTPTAARPAWTRYK